MSIDPTETAARLQKGIEIFEAQTTGPNIRAAGEQLRERYDAVYKLAHTDEQKASLTEIFAGAITRTTGNIGTAYNSYETVTAVIEATKGLMHAMRLRNGKFNGYAAQYEKVTSHFREKSMNLMDLADQLDLSTASTDKKDCTSPGLAKRAVLERAAHELIMQAQK